ELAAEGLPSPAELKLLTPFRDQLPEEVFTQAYAPPKTRGDGNVRRNLRQAIRLLKQAGWVIQERKLVHRQSGQAMRFEIMLASP
ncbi:MAG: ABC transporter substrate-binding protein, partial [Anaerolineae bacterium]|nr:ABC transporter substrate-binding protein [Anaerolineae bacterium]